jgi:hypothetical protein
MPLQYQKATSHLWTATAHFGEPRIADDLGVTIMFGGCDDQPDALSLRLAEKVSETLPEVQDQATQYLDHFIYRARIGPAASWWLDEIEIQRTRLGRPSCRFRFALAGDDAAEWYVDMVAEADTLRAYRMERYDGFALAHPA